MKKLKTIANTTLRIIVAVYLFFGVFLFMGQKKIIYHPDNQSFTDCPGFQDYEKINHKGTRLYYKPQDPKSVLIYYHGNAGSACDRSFVKDIFEASGQSLIFVEYAGYSNSKQNPSSKLILQDAENVIHFLNTKNYRTTTVYGQSIGTGPASYHSSRSNVDTLILTSPFKSLTNLAQSKYKIYPASLILTERYDNLTWLQNYQNKLLILHGEDDTLIPASMSKTLFNSIPSNQKTYQLILNRSHNDLWSDEKFVKAIAEHIR